METHKCQLCCAPYPKGAHNSKYCSTSCRKIINTRKKAEWHLKNKSSENLKSRARVAKYLSSQKKEIYKRYRLKKDLPILSAKECTICNATFEPKCHNSLSCSKECSKLLQLNKSSVSSKLRYNTDIYFKLRSSLRTRLNKAIKGIYKSGSAVTNLGCSIKEFKVYLESKFQPGMTWDNWGVKGWHIDHIVPLTYFNLIDPEQLKRACHYSNLQPLWAKDNLKKTNKI